MTISQTAQTARQAEKNAGIEIGSGDTFVLGGHSTGGSDPSFDAGEVIIVCVSCDDVSGVDSIGANAVTSTPVSLTFNRVLSSQQQTAAGGVCLAVFTAQIPVDIAPTDVPTGLFIRVTPNATAAAKAATASVWSGVHPTPRPGFSVLSSSTATPSVTAGSGTSYQPVVGELVVGVFGFEGADTPTADSDTSSGSWFGNSFTPTAMDWTGTSGGGAASNMAIVSQYKIVTATADQTFNPTIGTARDQRTTVLIFPELRRPDKIFVAPSQAAHRAAGW